MKRFLSGLLLAALLAGQTALPVAHEWRVAANEAGHHLGTPSGPAWSGPEDSSQGHEHHDQASCRICPTITQSKSGAGLNPGARPAALGIAGVPAQPPLLPSGLLEAGLHAPRGPPAA